MASKTGKGDPGKGANKYHLVDSLDQVLSERRVGKKATTVLDTGGSSPRSEGDYEKQRAEIVARESALSWDYVCKRDATELEKKANQILQALREDDRLNIYEAQSSARGYGGQEHRRFMGDHFLSNVDLIEKTKLFQVARAMPKGAHLHIHFNANLRPEVLIDIAKGMKRMFITSDVSLAPVDDISSRSPGHYANLERSRIQFSILSEAREDEQRKHHKTCNLFKKSYHEQKRAPMSFKDFLKDFGKHYPGRNVDDWLINKLVFHEQEAHGWHQTPDAAWERFNARTQMMKGLFNYKTAYVEYTKKCLQEFVDDGIQYAEIRPNFMKDNQLWTDDGTKRLNNEDIMDIIKEECDNFQKKQKKKGQYFAGIKVIYCTPRSFKNPDVEICLNECLDFKRSEKFGKMIAGFDLVGEESKGYPLKQFKAELIQFKEKCNKANVDIPFLFHCGETLEVGNDTDGNLYDALLLGAKRIGHGFALPRHPYVMEQMKKNNVCLELCPISNEILGLTPRANGHAMYSLLANNVHCTVNTDNGTLFRSRLSHDFYQVFAGKKDMTLFGWKQLAIWSIEHSCMDEYERAEVMKEWTSLWDKFVRDIIRNYGSVLNGQA